MPARWPLGGFRLTNRELLWLVALGAFELVLMAVLVPWLGLGPLSGFALALPLVLGWSLLRAAGRRRAAGPAPHGAGSLLAGSAPPRPAPPALAGDAAAANPRSALSPGLAGAGVGHRRPAWLGISCRRIARRRVRDDATDQPPGDNRRGDIPDDPPPLPLGVQGIGQHGILRSDGGLVAAVEVRPLNLDLLAESQLAAAVAGLAQLLASLPGPVQIVLRNRAFDPASHLADAARRWSATWDHKLDRRHRLLGASPSEADGDAGRPATYAHAVRAAHGRWHMRQVRCFVALTQKPPGHRGPWWSRRPTSDHGPPIPGAPEARVRLIREGLARAGMSSRRLEGLDLVDLVEGLFRSAPAPLQMLQDALEAAGSGPPARYRVGALPVTRFGFDLADPFPEWIACHPDHLVIQGPGPQARRLRILAHCVATRGKSMPAGCAGSPR